ncbi:DEAD/DEAH box helicase [Actinotalea sp. M2MS4P-6]|uniref:DEAD/DEAH box helicase n=1 Tax=Actinotalea sp. M2MS4P-6 TaxID=2983762 RepID=UPI0021E4AA0A|nr:DEAD/DEAH box helicase [Actinotalea sp. M2MS4P-6]MCV2394972.1 DEAD/DEAH box helicase [Actinotalea sp. M2MS4P-6]
MTSEAPDSAADGSADASATTTFADLGLRGPVLAAIADVGYETPSAIQAATIPPLLAGRDVLGTAQTGTGKTAAFALPILERLDRERGRPQALVLAPTRELALQVCEAFERYAAHSGGVHVLPIYGGQGYGVQLSALRRGVHVVVGTPGRIVDHLGKGTLDLSGLRFLVLDEADEMLSMGFAEDLETILGSTPQDKQVALFSATMPAPIRRLSQTYLRDPEHIAVAGRTQTATNVTQRYLVVSYAQKLDALTRILEVEDAEATIVFTRTKNETEVVAEKLRARGHAAAAINGDIQQVQREKTVKQLRSGDLDVLVATDVAARGLDVDRIGLVVNYDLPIDTESYVHRVGRTGRAGRAGRAISFVTPRERRLLTAIEKATRQPLTPMHLPSVEDVNATRLTRFDDSITEALGRAGEIDQFRDIVAHYVAHHDVPEVDVAAALALAAHGGPLLLDAEAEQVREQFEADRRAATEGRQRGGKAAHGGRDRRLGGAAMTTYRIAVGRRHKVEPRQIMGAIANEGGLGRGDVGAISIHSGFSLVDLPSDLPAGVLRRLGRTRISGQLIDLRPDTGRRAPARGASRGGAPGARKGGQN